MKVTFIQNNGEYSYNCIIAHTESNKSGRKISLYSRLACYLVYIYK